MKASILNSPAELSFSELKNIKSFTDLATSNALKEIEFQRFKGLIKSNLLDVITQKVKEESVPFLGICVGMQMLASHSFENGKFVVLYQ